MFCDELAIEKKIKKKKFQHYELRQLSPYLYALCYKLSHFNEYSVPY